MAASVRVLGIDLAGKTGGTTAVALARGAVGAPPEVEVVREHGGAVLGKRPALRRLAELASALAVELVAVDAPLTLPHVWTCDEADCDECFPPSGEDPVYTLRPAETAAAWDLATDIHARPMPTVMISPIAVRGAYLRRAIERTGIPTLETWPAGVLRQLGDRTATKPKPSTAPDAYVAWARAALAGRVDTDWTAVDGPDAVDAVAAAFAGWVHAVGAGQRCVHVGEPEPICIPA